MKTQERIAFSENGYHLASCGSDDDTVRIWDIRKGKVLESFNLHGEICNNIKFDHSGLFLMTSGTNVGLYNLKEREFMKLSNKNKNEGENFSSLNCNSDLSYLMSSGLNGEISFYN